jgi:hypothetical protein
LHQESGGSYFVPGTSRARFIANASGISPECRERDGDVFVTMRYGPRRDGRPFVMLYRIARRTTFRSGAADVDVAEEIRAGRIRGYSQRWNDGDIIVADIRGRAAEISRHMAFE